MKYYSTKPSESRNIQWNQFLTMHHILNVIINMRQKTLQIKITPTRVDGEIGKNFPATQ